MNCSEQFHLLLDEDKRYALEIVSTLLNLVQTKDSEKHSDIKNCAKTLLPQLMKLITTAAMDAKSHKSQIVILSDEVTKTVNLIFITVLKNLSTG
jgi:hypothetical protein